MRRDRRSLHPRLRGPNPSQVVYVWFHALANYITALGFGSDGDAYRRWWCESDGGSTSPARADAAWSLVAEANRFVARSRPWELADEERDAVVGHLLGAYEVAAQEIEPLLPAAAGRIRQALATRDRELGRALFPKPDQRVSRTSARPAATRRQSS